MLPVNGLYGHIRANTLRSALLLAGFAGLVGAYWLGLCLAWTAIGFVTDFASPAVSSAETFDAIAARAWERALDRWYVPVAATAVWFAIAWLFYGAIIRASTGAHPVSRRESPRLHAMVERIAIAAGLPTPRLEIMETAALNAYAAGLSPEDATIAVTRGLLETLEPRELEAVIAHEMVHIRNRDVRLMVIALIFAGGITLLGSLIARLLERPRSGAWSAGDFDTGGGWSSADGHHRGLGASGAPAFVAIIGALLVAAATMALTHVGAIMTRLAISRARELMADAGAVELTKDPDALISALRKISGNDYVPVASDDMTALMISASFDADDFVEALFATHPTVEARVAALARHAGGLESPPSRRRTFRRPLRIRA